MPSVSKKPGATCDRIAAAPRPSRSVSPIGAIGVVCAPPPAGSRATDEAGGAGFISRWMDDQVLSAAAGLPALAADTSTRRIFYEIKANVSRAQVAALVSRYEKGRDLGFMGESRVNVLQLNLALDQSYPVKK